MKLGVLTNLLADVPFAEAAKYFASLGIQAVEIGCGGYPGKAHADPDVLLNDEKALNDFRDVLKKNDLMISAFSCHGNPVHPNKDIAKSYDEQFRKAILLCEKMGVNTIVGFSGCPGDSPNSQYPNWVTCAWPEDFLAIKDYQGNECLIPYWTEMAAFARDHGVTRIAFEMHPGFCVYNPETLLNLRAAVGPEIGANFDPSHLVWQGIEPAQAIKALKDCMWHFHAKDTRIDKANTAVNGVLDYKHYSDVMNRSWVFRTIGYGSGEDAWREIVSALRTIDYDYVMSIEHEDSLMSQREGLEKAVKTLKEVMTFSGKGVMTWA